MKALRACLYYIIDLMVHLAPPPQSAIIHWYQSSGHRDRDRKRPRQRHRKTEEKHLIPRKGGQRARVQDVLISSSHCQQQGERWCGCVTPCSSSDEWSSVYWPTGDENVPVRTQLPQMGQMVLSVVQLNGLHLTNNARVRSSIPNGYPC